ncbi:MAG: methyltransferase domain-containing protein [Candidatus Saccharibacteria bacterium]|nr:methyltransferase domain-containing protein [Candidatus Saccharibacteria bacterium]
MRSTNLNKENGIAKYYSRFGSWAGYNLALGRSQHAGFWTEGTKNERQAQRNYLQKLAAELNIQPGEKVLDAGSGQGYAARYLAENGAGEITGITITPREVFVSEKLSRRTPNRPKFVLGDYSATDFPDQIFDVIYTTETLSHAKDMNKVMREFYRILKPGGRIVFFDYELNTTKLVGDREKILIFLRDHAGGYGLWQQNSGQISGALSEAGFENISEDDISAQTKPTFDRLRRLAKPFSWIRPDSKLAQHFVNAVMATYFYSNLYESGEFRYLIYKATKK